MLLCANVRCGTIADIKIDLTYVDKLNAVERSEKTDAQVYRYNLLLLMMCAGCAPARDPDVYELSYGTTRYIPMTDKVANDFIENDVQRIPPIIDRCGAKFIAFDGQITDGGEAAYFGVINGTAIQCIEHSVPQATIRPAPAALIDKLRKKLRF